MSAPHPQINRHSRDSLRSSGLGARRGFTGLALFFLFLVLACNTDLPTVPEEEGTIGETKIHLSVKAIKFDPTLVGDSSIVPVVVTYNDTAKLELGLFIEAEDSLVFSVEPSIISLPGTSKQTVFKVKFAPRLSDSDSVMGYLYLAAYSWADSEHARADTVGLDTLTLSGVGLRYFLDPELVFIPGGPFVMGADSTVDTTDYRYRDELFAHQVTVSDFFIGRYEITNIQYFEFWNEDSTGHTPKSDTASVGRWPDVALKKPNYPVAGVSWYDALAFCQWLSMKTGERYTLPTEAQWEYAACGGKRRQYPWSVVQGETAEEDTSGAEPLYANVRLGVDGYTYTAPVDAFADGRSAFGVLNLAGNVWEWCWDWYDPLYYRQQQSPDPQGPDDPEHRTYKVIRGGSWREELEEARCTNRGASAPDNREVNCGFRVVRLP